MTIPAWPSTVPDRPVQGGLTPSDPYRPPLKTEVEDGPEILRVQSHTIISKFEYSIAMTAAQFAAWKTFVTTTLGQGTSRFTMTVGILGSGYATKTCYIDGGQWKASPLGSKTMVSFTLCVLNGL